MEVHHLEIVIGRLRAASRQLSGATVEPGGLPRICHNLHRTDYGVGGW